jgi:hypothetical protein
MLPFGKYRAWAHSGVDDAAGNTLWRRREYIENNCGLLGTAYERVFQKMRTYRYHHES